MLLIRKALRALFGATAGCSNSIPSPQSPILDLGPRPYLELGVTAGRTRSLGVIAM